MGYVFHYSNPENLSNRLFSSIDGYQKYLIDNNAYPVSGTDALITGISDTAKELEMYISHKDSVVPAFLGIRIESQPIRYLFAYKTGSTYYLFSSKEDDVRFVNGKEYPVKQVDLCNIYGDDLK
ncbi:MAG: hypothetical protein PHP22_06745 [Oscillospiraceae bacterium]|nr:hypothetical protein [Oscillospiraceae bacterium]